MLRHLPSSAQRLRQPCAGGAGLLDFRFFSNKNPPGCEEVPQGHKDSELTPHTCHAGLLRRKELYHLRHVQLQVDGKTLSVKDVFKGGLQIAFGVPDRGKVCSEQHAPGFAKALQRFKELEVQLPVLCVSQGTAREAEQWASKLGLKPEEVRQVVDVGGRLTRYLGVELGIGEEGGPKSQRWAAILDNGVLLNLFVDKTPAAVDVSGAENLVQAVETMREAQKGL